MRRAASQARRAVLLAFGLVLVVSLPVSFLEALPSACLFLNVFGFECPGCGITRAIFCLLHGQFAQALGYNRGVVVVFPTLCCVALRYVWPPTPAPESGPAS